MLVYECHGYPSDRMQPPVREKSESFDRARAPPFGRGSPPVTNFGKFVME